VDVITLGGRTVWGKRQYQSLPFMCALIICLRVGLGVAQWKAVDNGVSVPPRQQRQSHPSR